MSPTKTSDDAIPTDPEAIAYQRFDAEDDQQVLAEIQGRNLEILDRLVYSYADRRGNTVTGLSLTGVRETIREMNRREIAKIRVTESPPIIHETDEYIDVLVYAEDTLNGGGSWGSKRQSKKTGNFSNPFALEQAVGKAQRNAMFALIPASYVVEVIQAYAELGKSHELKTGPRRIAEPKESPKQLPAPAGAPASSESQPEIEPDEGKARVSSDRVSPNQLGLMRSLLGRADFSETELLAKLQIDSLENLPKQRASQVIDRLIQRAERSKQAP